jgi:hypothetical protein
MHLLLAPAWATPTEKLEKTFCIALPQPGQTTFFALAFFWRTSSTLPQPGHLYSKIGNFCISCISLALYSAVFCRASLTA